jgi:tryptophanase
MILLFTQGGLKGKAVQALALGLKKIIESSKGEFDIYRPQVRK